MRHSSVLAALVLIATVPATPAFAESWISATGSDASGCTITSPCQSLARGFQAASDVVHCLDSNGYSTGGAPFIINKDITIDCSNTTASAGPIIINGSNITVHLIGLRVFGWGGISINFQNGAALFIEKCKMFRDGAGVGIQMEPSTAAELHVTDSEVTEDPVGVLLKPAAGGSIDATFDHVKISKNTGGGIRIDTTNGRVTVDITDSEISGNTGNGLNAVGGNGGPAIFNISRSVIAKNGVAGVQVNGASAAAMIDTTLLDSNATGATTAINGGHMLTYGNNRIVGTAGSGFTGSAALQ